MLYIEDSVIRLPLWLLKTETPFLLPFSSVSTILNFSISSFTKGHSRQRLNIPSLGWENQPLHICFAPCWCSISSCFRFFLDLESSIPQDSAYIFYSEPDFLLSKSQSHFWLLGYESYAGIWTFCILIIWNTYTVKLTIHIDYSECLKWKLAVFIANKIYIVKEMGSRSLFN